MTIGGTGMHPVSLHSVTAGGDCAVLRAVGEIDVYTAPRLREHVIDLVGNGVWHVVADLRAVTFLDSTGLGALIGSLKRLRAHDGSLALVIGDGRVFRIFRVTGLDRVFALEPSVREALRARPPWRAAVTADGHTIDEWCDRHELR
jgi:anti-sigma B factor antagonist